MIETLIPLKLPPGIFRNGTTYQASGRWNDAHLVRFAEGTIQPVGGWRAAQDDAGSTIAGVAGVARAAIGWRAEDGAPQVAVGTNSRLYAIIGGVLSDITPSGFTTGGINSSYASGGYGAGSYGSGPYGTGSLAQALDEAGVWQLDTFGDFLVGVMTDDGKLYVWQGNPASAAAEASGAPQNNRAVVVTPERFLVALGAGGNVRLVQWASRETINTWTPATTNSAGDFELQTNGRIMAGRRTDTNTLIWTDTDLHEMNYVGGEFIYGFRRVGDNCGLLAPNAVATAGGRVFWMGKSDFYTYDGYVQTVPSEVKDYVFSDFNDTQAIKVFAVALNEFSEIWWFYPSASSEVIDRYVVYNYKENHWTIGRLGRNAGFGSGATPHPMMLALAYSAKGTLTSTGTNPANGATVTIGSKTYTFQTVLTDVDGNVFIGANAAATLANLKDAINLGSGAGTDYATSMTRHPTVTAEEITATTLVVRAKASGVGGNAIATTETSTQLSWGAATLAGGGDSVNGYAVSDLYEHEVGDDWGSEQSYIESGPFEIEDGNRVVRVQRLVPDDTTQGNGSVKFYTSNFPNDAETERVYTWSDSPTNVRFTARLVRMRLEPNMDTDWRVGIFRLGGIPGGRR